MMVSEIPLRERSVVFIGFMGVGKTTIGKLVAKKLDRDFIDIDEEIEKEFNMPTSQIFNKIGEKAFREREKSLIKDLVKRKTTIISLGGGAFLQEETRNICLANSIVFFLDLSWESWKERISLIIDSRPVLQNRSLEEIEELYYKRQEIYSVHHFKVSTDSRNTEEVADYIIETLKNARDLHKPR